MGLVTVNVSELMTLKYVIPTEKPLGFDEESPVGTTKLSIIRITYHSKLRSFHSLFNSLIKAIFLSLR